MLCDWVKVGKYLVAPTYSKTHVSIQEAKQIAEQQGCLLPTPELVDLIYQQADLKLTPKIPKLTQYTHQEMNSSKVIQWHQSQMQQQIDAHGDFRLLAGGWKDVIEVNGKLGIYGMHRENGTPIQPPYFKHSLNWIDWSQACRLVKLIA